MLSKKTNLLANNPYYRIGAESWQGGRTENQDNCAFLPLNDDGSCCVLSVCDGMGGNAGGRTASYIAVDFITYILKEQVALIESGEDKTVRHALQTAIQKANQVVWERSQNDENLHGMGTTTITLLLTPTAAWVAQVGDSRCYQLRNGRKVFRTFDHSRVFELVAVGYYSEEQARTAPGSNVITRAVGIRPKIEVEIQKLPYKAGDRFILCSDGIWNTMPENDLIELLQKKNHAEEQANFAAEIIDGIGQGTGQEYDNLTIMVADIKNDSAYQKTLCQKLGEQTSILFKTLKRRMKR